MTLYTNHCYCTDSIWGGMYDCRYILTINQGHDTNQDEFDPEKYSKDWTNVLTPVSFFDEKGAKAYKERKPSATEEDLKDFFTKETFKLKKEVVQWLENNVKDRKGEDCSKGWAVGTHAYNERAMIHFNIFFHRKQDALNFIEKWGHYSKPMTYFNYFDDKRYKLDVKTMKMKKVENFD